MEIIAFCIVITTLRRLYIGFSSTVPGRFRKINSKEAYIERQHENIITYPLILLGHILRWPLRLFFIRIHPGEWFLYEYSSYNNYEYYLINRLNQHSRNMKTDLGALIEFRRVKEEEIKCIEDYEDEFDLGYNIARNKGKWMDIPKSIIYCTGRMTKPKEEYKDILNDNALKRYQKGRKNINTSRHNEDAPVRTRTLYTSAEKSPGMDRVFEGLAQANDADQAIHWRKEDPKKSDAKSMRKKQEGETDQNHQKRMKYMNKNPDFNPSDWNYETGEPK